MCIIKETLITRKPEVLEISTVSYVIFWKNLAETNTHFMY
jgi:hypothetical protein